MRCLRSFDFVLALGMAAGLAMLLVPSTTFAQTDANCAPRQVVVERLEHRFAETVQMIGLGGGNRLLELYASPDTGTWSIVITTTEGVACLVASGVSFEQVTAPPLFEGDDL